MSAPFHAPAEPPAMPQPLSAESEPQSTLLPCLVARLGRFPAWLAACPCLQLRGSCWVALHAPGWQGAGCAMQGRRAQRLLLRLLPLMLCCSCRR